MFSKVITVSLNPSLDVTVWVKELDFEEPCFAEREAIYPGGKGINVARVLTMLGMPAKALSMAGKDNLHMLARLVAAEHVEAQFLELENQAIRENLTLVLEDGRVLKVNRSGPAVNPTAWEQFSDMVNASVDSQTLAVFAGSLSPGISPQDYRDLIARITAKGIPAAVDTNVFTPEDYKLIKPFVIKPNLVELAKIFQTEVHSAEEAAVYAGHLSQDVTHVLVSLGGDGLLYAGGGEQLLVKVPKVYVKSTVGAGDTTLAAFLYALQQGSVVEAVQFAAAAGTASVTCDGTEIPSRDKIEEILAQITIVPLYPETEL